jgi:vacuolar-type H+-ATPase subunit F/Vma7
MKNIHVLKTSKPSKLLKDLVDKTYQFKKEATFGNRIELPLNIYITSDEEIKEGDWWLNIKTNDVDKCTYKSEVSVYNSQKYQHIKKIILTTDQDLIKDGVQAIDDEFLEWFVKNTSCEKAGVINTFDYNKKHFVEHSGYKIIIPKEEPKQEPGKETADYIDRHIVEALVEVAKQKMYSEEEVEDLIYKVCGTVARLQGITLNGNHIDTAYKKFKKK